MVRKRLSDLLREEAQRSLDTPESDATPPEEQPSEGRSPSAKRPPSNRARSAAQSSTKPRPTRSGSNSPMSPPPEPPAEPSTPVPTEAVTADLKEKEALIAEFKETIADLQTSLHQSKHAEEVLRQEVATLQAELEQQQAAIAQLQATLTQATQHHAELEEARATILKLSENNIQLSRELAQQQASDRPAIALSQTHSVTTPAAARVAPEPTQPRNAMQVTKTALREILRHPIQPQQPSNVLTNEDIGWVD